MIKKLDKVVIVGGGSAGWMTAATLIKFYPEKEIVVIESPNIPIVGVGESTIGGLKTWVNALEIDEDDFMKYTDASYKMSIKFTDFYDKDSGSFHYPFGLPFTGQLGPNNTQISPQEILKMWHYKKGVFPETPVQDYCRTYWPTMPLIENNKFSKNESGEFDNYYPETNVVYHFDATKFGAWLRDRYAKPKGVIHIQGEVVTVNTDENGVSNLVLDNGDIIYSDLYVDCTGWKSLLLGDALKEPFNSYDHILPNNKAWAAQLQYKDKEKELEPFTNCTALGNGWAWNIPLWSRLGTGYVYSDKYISPEDAKQEFKNYLMSDKMVSPRTQEEVDALEFKDINMRIGLAERLFVKNVVAIGLSAGFIEPLESNGLFTIHQFLLKLVDTINRGPVSQWDKDVYNVSCKILFDSFAHFVSLHYALSHRTDTQYWKDISTKTFSNMQDLDYLQTSGFFELAKLKMVNGAHELTSGMNCVATGMNFFLYSQQDLLPHPIYKQSYIKEYVENFVKSTEYVQLKWKKAAEDAPTLYQYLKDKYDKA
jgi:tryptophan halogenase